MKLKLKEMLEDREMDNKEMINKKTKKKLQKKAIIAPPLRAYDEIFCSICASPLPNYIPDYFCGQQLNPACHCCKEKNSSDDPFQALHVLHRPPLYHIG